MTQEEMKKTYDNSQLTTFSMCPFKYYCQYIKGLSKVDCDDTVIKFQFGNWVHQFLEHHFKGKDTTPENIWNNFDEFLDEQVLTKENGVKACKLYLEQYKNDKELFNILDVEQIVEFPIGNYRFVVKLDTIVKQQGCKYSLEHKTTQKSPRYALKVYEYSSQVSAQCYAVKLKYGSCSGVQIDMIRPQFVTKPILIDPSMTEEINMYSIVEYKYSRYYKQEMAYCSGFTCQFERNIYNRFDEQIEGWKINAEKIIGQIEQAKQDNYFVKHDHGYWCTGCPYGELCIMSHNMKLDEAILDMSYKTVNPYEYLEIGK